MELQNIKDFKDINDYVVLKLNKFSSEEKNFEDCITTTKTVSEKSKNLSKQNNMLDIYIATIPEKVNIKKLYPKERDIEIKNCKNEKVIKEKYYVWKLLEYAVNNSFKYKFNKIKFIKNENGKWTCKEFYFSLSHSNNVVAVGISQNPVGIDIEEISKFENKKIEKYVLSNEELTYYEKLEETEKVEYLAKMWTSKESMFKSLNEKHFSPSNIKPKNTKSVKLNINNKDYYLSVTNENFERYTLHKVELN